MKIGKPGANRYVVAAEPFNNEVAVIPLAPSTCTLGTPSSIATSGGSPTGVDFSPTNNILYVADANFGTLVEAFAFPAGTALAGSPYFYTSGSNSNVVLASKNGSCLFVSNQFSSSVTAIPLTGGVPGSTATAYPAGNGGQPAGMANDVSGKWFYVASVFDNTVTTEIIGSGCALTEAVGTPALANASGFLLSLTAYP